jgi:subtilisin family serine protease
VRTAARWILAVTLIAATVTGYTPPAHADEVRDGQWHLEQLRVTVAHALSRGDGVTVAVLDSGVDASHPDLRDNVRPGADLTGHGTDGRDDAAGAGTALAGLIAGHGHGTGRADGVLGLAPAAAVLPVVIADPGTSPQAVTVAAGIDEAVRRGADVICIGRPLPDDPAVTRVVAAAVTAGAVVVVPAVPAGDALARYGGLGVLGALPTAIGDVAPSPGAGPGTVAVPGVNVLSTGAQGGYFVHARTSGAAAAAVLAGAAALVRAAFPELPAYALTDRVTATAAGGGLDLVAALTATVPAPPSPPPPPPATSPPVVTPSPTDPATQVAAFDSEDWHRWLVGAPLVGFLVILTAMSVAGARRARRLRR